MDIVLIGAGPRGLVAAERIIERQKKTDQFGQLTITLVDPFGVGGRVWQPNQSHDLIMNTNPDQITMFTDQTSEINGPIVPGLNLYDWIKTKAAQYIQENNIAQKKELLNEITDLKSNGYASRGLFGVYLNWFYEYLQTRLIAEITLSMVYEEAIKVQSGVNENEYLVQTSNHELHADYVVMALGHCENKPTPEQVKLRQFANQVGINYIYPTQPQEYDFENLAAGQTMIARGLGLSFFDAVAMLTTGRGGKFTRASAGQLVYHASGREPKIVAGSRLGVPLRAKGRNEKKNDERATAHFFTPKWFHDVQLKGGIAGEDFLTMAHHEVEYVYYEKLIQQKYSQMNVEKFLTQFALATDPTQVVLQSEIDSDDYFNWEKLMNPTKFIGDSSDPEVMADYLQRDADAANEGTKTGPLTSALEVFRDIRDVLRQIVNYQLLSPDDYRKDFLGQFNYENSHLAVGPPEIRIEELRALVLAGIVKILGPEMMVDTDEHVAKFVTWSKLKPEQRYTADYLLEARLPSIKVEQSQNQLMQHLLADKLAQPHELVLADGTEFKTGALNVDTVTQQLIVDGEANQHLYVWGIPTEGKQWFTTASPRPYINDVTFRSGDAIVDQIFKSLI
ncbi:FAD/NAD(P)-binding protein [Paucilactobacillus kaifaensis]|uniref:FAD/NAD(P)-binding protein n=1 Tax=Paucilactobacillus kaifaensis TaxID=2559921 RepID=UPI0010F684E4|nr:FAD/NAD(P)-binding protein [Paucilactobacillus kaifaensis]